jgi:hypothetical protein
MNLQISDLPTLLALLWQSTAVPLRQKGKKLQILRSGSGSATLIFR